jgi:hypothetical protein
VTGLGTHIWLNIWLVKWWAFDIYPSCKVLTNYMLFLIQLKSINSDLMMISHYYFRSSAILAIWCKFSCHVPCSCSFEFHFDLTNFYPVMFHCFPLSSILYPIWFPQSYRFSPLSIPSHQSPDILAYFHYFNNCRPPATVLWCWTPCKVTHMLTHILCNSSKTIYLIIYTERRKWNELLIE